MNPSAITLLKAIRDGISLPKEIMNVVGIKEWQFNNLVKDLISQDYLEKTDSALTFKQGPKTVLFKDVAAKFDIEKLLHDSNELVFKNLIEPKTINEITDLTRLSLRTVQRAVSELESIGAIKKEENKVSINRDYGPLYLFAENLRREDGKSVEPYAEVIYQDHVRTLKKVPKEKRVDGELTGFSLFADYGIEYHTTHDYYIKQDAPLELADVLVHAVLAASKEQDKHGIVMAMVFYLKNKQRLDPLQVRKIAKDFKISDIWVDIEGYLRNTPVKNQNLFLPWSEFEEKVKLYSISSENYTLPVAYPDLFKEIGRWVPPQTEAYLLGGENMRIKGLKPRTKDCDLVVSDEKSFINIVETLKKMGYTSVNKDRLSEDDLRIAASDILEHPTRSRVDIFKRIIASKLALSDKMAKRAKVEEYGNLRLGIMANEDVFLLKSVTLREGDIQDMTRIAQSSGFNWNIVWDEMVRQEKDRFERFSEVLLNSLDYLYEQTSIRAPFYRKLVRHVLDYEISKQIRDGGKAISEIVSLLKGGDITEKMIRNRIDYLERMKFLRKTKRGNDVYLEPRKRTVLNVPGKTTIDLYAHALQAVENICTKLGLSEATRKRAIEIIDVADKAHWLEGRRPNVVAGAAVRIAAVAAGQQYLGSVDRIATVAKASKVRIYGTRKEMRIALKI